MKCEHELALEKPKQENSTAAINNASINTKAPQLSLFDDNRDIMDVYLERFERFATIQKWKQKVGQLFSAHCFLDKHWKHTQDYPQKRQPIIQK